jgi:hypothetical protein
MINGKMKGSTIIIVYLYGVLAKNVAPKKEGLGGLGGVGGVYME